MYTKKFPKSDRYTLGQKVFSTLLDILTIVMKAEYLPREKKKFTLLEISPHLDMVKILIRLSYSLQIVTDKDYIRLETEVEEIGKMLGGWIRSL